MDCIREIVAGPKNRYQKEGYNIDLSYITNNIIAMSFPGEMIESLYRNPIGQVAKFLKKTHGNNYLVFNLSCKKYDFNKFGGSHKVRSFHWIDEQAPPLLMLFEICVEIHDFLSQKPENVVVIHCKAGRGRTGSQIICFMLFCGLFKDPQQSINYFFEKRFIMNKNQYIMQPCQIQYIHYFHQILKNIKIQKKIYPGQKRIKQFVITGRPQYQNKECIPYIQIYDIVQKKLLYTTHKPHQQQTVFNKRQSIFEIDIPEITISGDILIKLKNNNQWLKDTLIGQIQFNTAFIPQNNTLTFPLSEISTLKCQKDKRIPRDFQIGLYVDNNDTRTDNTFSEWNQLYSNLNKSYAFDQRQTLQQDQNQHLDITKTNTNYQLEESDHLVKKKQ